MGLKQMKLHLMPVAEEVLALLEQTASSELSVGQPAECLLTQHLEPVLKQLALLLLHSPPEVLFVRER